MADQADNYGLRMTIYCGILEHISQSAKKELEVQAEIECLIKHVKGSKLTNNQKNQLIEYLKNGKDVSSRQKLKSLCGKYAAKQYGKHSLDTIVNEAYSIRSKYAHGEECIIQGDNPAKYLKYVVLDVIKNYMREKENEVQA